MRGQAVPSSAGRADGLAGDVRPAPDSPDHDVSRGVPHERIRGVISHHRRDPVSPRLGATDPAVPVVVPQRRLTHGTHGSSRHGRHFATARTRSGPSRRTHGQHLVQRVRFTPVRCSNPYCCRAATRTSSGSAPKATAPSWSIFWYPCTRGPASVRFSRLLANRRLSVSDGLANHVPA